MRLGSILLLEGGVRQMLTLADKGGRGGLANADITDKNA